MPRGIPKKKNPEMYKDATPPPTTAAPNTEPVRPQIKQMTGFKSAEEMAASLPTDTMTSAPEERPRKYTRKPKQEEAPRDPLLDDPRYKKAIASMQGFGGPKIVKGGFSAVALATSEPAIALNGEEGEQLDDFFYVLGKRYQALDPSGHWFTMLLYFLSMLGTFIFTRVMSSKGNSLQKQLAQWFGGKDEDEKEEESK